MKVHRVSGRPAPSLARALAEFEAPFTYPLGPGQSFSISHGEDYTSFFRAQGDAVCFIAEHQGRIAGTLGTAIRRLSMPDGAERMVAYLGDLKIAADARGGTVLVRLARAAEAWLRPQVDAAFGVVMGGTARTPEAYTSRAGIPGFKALGRLAVLRVSSLANDLEPVPKSYQISRDVGLACYRRLSRGRHACPTIDAPVRSRIDPVWLMHPDRSACGMLEDTRNSKRLIMSDGSELLSAHLSCFAFDSVPAGAGLIGVALRKARALGLPAVFVAVAERDAMGLGESMRGVETLAAPATVYGTGTTSRRPGNRMCRACPGEIRHPAQSLSAEPRGRLDDPGRFSPEPGTIFLCCLFFPASDGGACRPYPQSQGAP
jgi:hypothetical protein